MITDPLQTRPDFHSGSESPTKPGVYWFHSETASRAMLVEVRMTNGNLTMWCPIEEQCPRSALAPHIVAAYDMPPCEAPMPFSIHPPRVN